MSQVLMNSSIPVLDVINLLVEAGECEWDEYFQIILVLYILYESFFFFFFDAVYLWMETAF